MKKELVYLAAPYSHSDPQVKHDRFLAINQTAAKLIREGLFVFSPIPHTHPIALAGNLPTGWDFWEVYDRIMLSACGSVIILMLDGWQESRGVQAEITIAKELGLPISYREETWDVH